MHADLSDMPLWVAGSTGQAALALSGETAGLRAEVDQHEASVRAALGGPLTADVLMSYARGFVEAAIARGWRPPSGDQAGSVGLGGSIGPYGSDDLGGSGHLGRSGDWLDALIAREAGVTEPDWESLRLAAVCRLFLETQDLRP
jgi:hypothetical protein